MEEGGSSRGDGGSRSSGGGKGAARASSGGAFRAYTPVATEAIGSSKSSSLRVMRRSLVARLTKDIVETFQLCNPKFEYSGAVNLKRFLTNPSHGVLNDGDDNANSDLILHVDSVLVNSDTNQRYFVKDLLGQGTFGQVAKCWVPENDSFVAVKVIKNQTAYFRQALVEVSILTTLNQKLAHDEKRHIVRILDYFIYKRHLCISFELLGSNLYELIKMNKYRGLPLSIVQVFSKQMLHALVFIKEAGIIHCDLKPENVLLSTSTKPEIKVIDFGSACMEGHTVYSYIQSRYYRSPEVLLGYPYTASIDMWSFGCIVAELFLGLPLFAGASEYDLLKRMVEILGGQPPDYLLRDAKGTEKFFKHVASIYRLEDERVREGVASAYQILTIEEHEARVSQKPAIGKRYFSQVNLEDIIRSYPYRKNLSDEEISKENNSRLALVDFLRGLVEFDPGKRWSPLQASRHPFVTGEPYTCPYKPLSENSRIPVMRAVIVDHNPGGGHWLATGLSPQVPGPNRSILHNSPHFNMMPSSRGSSFGSHGSRGGYNDSTGLGCSYGSYGDVNSMSSYFSPRGPGPMNMQTQVGGPFLGVSPDARRGPPVSHGNGFGMSPGSLGPMSVGASPSRFTPSSAGGIHGSPLGRAAAVGQFNRRSWQGNHGDGSSLQADVLSRGHFGSPHNTFSAPNHSNWRQQMGPPASNQVHPTSSSFHTNPAPSHSAEGSTERIQSNSSLPDPADWDPNYSDELLLQEDNSEVADNSEVSSLAFGVSTRMRISNRTDALTSSEVGSSSQGLHQTRTSSSFISASHRANRYQAYPHVENGPHFAHEMHAGQNQFPTASQNSPSRFGQQSAHHHNQYSTYARGERTHHEDLAARGNSLMDSRAAAHSTFGGGMPWGRRGGYPVATSLPSSHARQDYGRIS